ncbi:hypothetical protein DFV88_24845 [Salmonella enterica subsp. enterica serovar Newport]|nr:hypothetical protein [Salmonella enterica subsp. enterica serovar Newport]
MNLSALVEQITPEALETLTPDQLTGLYESLKAYSDYKKYNRLEYFEPYPYQRKFMNAGLNHTSRYMRAGNRTGKTYGAAAEMAYHLTGRYPFWWEGARIEGSNHVFWGVGITQESAANVMQKELFGSSDCRVNELIGSGALPRDAIEFKLGWEQDGPKLKSCMIRHVSGGVNTFKFHGCDNPQVLHGAKCAVIWIDEEAINAMEVYSICRARLTNALGTGKSGQLILTATPERGYTPLNKLFDEDETGVLYIQSASWDDCPNFSPEMIEKELSQYPKWQHEMRRRGLPVLGTGAVFDVADEQIKIMAVNPGPDWEAIAAIDWAENLDPTAVVVALRNLSNMHYYITDVFYLDGDSYSRSPANVAAILQSTYPGITVIRPHDHPALSNQLRELGINVSYEPFRNPPQSELKANRAISRESAEKSNSIEVGLDEMRLLFSEDRLKVLAHCEKWFIEKNGYFYSQDKNTGKVRLKGQQGDHALDASRYAILSLMANRGCTYEEAFDPATADWSPIENLPFTI